MSLRNLSKTLGPGLLFASTAIGVSHLVQSTRAGATYGFALVGFIIAANVFKFPFFEYGSRYANVTGESIIDGYKRIGNWMVWIYFLVLLTSMFFVSSAVSFVTAGFMKNLFQIPDAYGAMFTPTFLFVLCVSILAYGKYKALDVIMKIVGILLLFSTLLAFILTLINGRELQSVEFIAPVLFDDEGKGVLFIIALMGWMPTAVDLSTWNSLWTVARIKESGYRPKLSETLLEFNLGYWISAGLSLCFVTLGAYLIYGTGKLMPEGSAGFANEVIHLYTSTIGQWSYFIIALSAFSIMFGTNLGVFDGYARALEKTSELLFFTHQKKMNSKLIYTLSLLLIAISAFFVIYYFADKPSGFKSLIDLATTVSFLISPIIAIVNFRLVNKKYVGNDAEPSLFMKALSYIGILFLTGFAIYFVIIKL